MRLTKSLKYMESVMEKYQNVGAMDSEADRCLQVSMIYTYLSGDIHRRVSWQLFDMHEDFIEAHVKMDAVLQLILGIIEQRAFAMKSRKKRKQIKNFLQSYCTRLGVWEEAIQLADTLSETINNAPLLGMTLTF